MFWEPVTFKVGDCLHWQVGPCKLWVRRTEDEWQTTLSRVNEESALIHAQAQDAPTTAVWTRWAAMPDDLTFRLSPVMPDRPVIVRPESTFVFPPQSDLLFYVSIPIWLRLCTGSVGQHLLRDEPVSVLSNSWFGDPMEGSLCYALKTTARRTPQALRVRPYLAGCPIHIRNESEVFLPFDRLCVHTAHLRIYRDATRFWTNQVEVTYSGEAQPHSIKYVQGTPEAASEAELISEAHEPVRRNLFQQSFSDLKAFVRI